MKRKAEVWCIAYTDGACSGNPGAGGWAIMLELWPVCVIQHGGEDDTTNNRMELLAVTKALEEFLRNRSLQESHAGLEVKSDSAYVVNAVNQCWLQKWRMKDWMKDDGEPVANADLWKRFYKLFYTFSKREIPLKMTKVKGHSGEPGNEAVDWFAHEESQTRRKGKSNGKHRG